MWPVIVRHLAWERRLFRREFGPEKLPLYEAYAAIWASDNLQYDGGGTAHASAYNYYHNKMAARLAPLVGSRPGPLRARSRPDRPRHARIALAARPGRASPNTRTSSACNSSTRARPSGPFTITMDSGLPTPAEAWQMTLQVDREIPHLPVRGTGVPEGLHTLAESNWMPYDWSVNNVVMDEAVHTALGFWQAGRPRRHGESPRAPSSPPCTWASRPETSGRCPTSTSIAANPSGTSATGPGRCRARSSRACSA